MHWTYERNSCWHRDNDRQQFDFHWTLSRNAVQQLALVLCVFTKFCWLKHTKRKNIFVSVSLYRVFRNENSIFKETLECVILTKLNVSMKSAPKSRVSELDRAEWVCGKNVSGKYGRIINSRLKLQGGKYVRENCRWKIWQGKNGSRKIWQRKMAGLFCEKVGKWKRKRLNTVVNMI